jgi:hypothetical protein
VANVLALSGGKWRCSWDNDKVHQAAKLGDLHLERVPLSPFSPDMHCVVEHAIGRTWRRFKRRAQLEMGVKASMDEYKDLLEECFNSECDTATIWADCARLPTLYKVISAPEGQEVEGYQGSGGGWPHPKLYH